MKESKENIEAYYQSKLDNEKALISLKQQYFELVKKCRKFEEYMASDSFNDIKLEEQKLIYNQLMAMKVYKQSLAFRLEYYKVDVE
jgi:hypothetical protein